MPRVGRGRDRDIGRDRGYLKHRPDGEVLSTKAGAEAHRLLDMCRKNGIVQVQAELVVGAS